MKNQKRGLVLLGGLLLVLGILTARAVTDARADYDPGVPLTEAQLIEGNTRTVMIYLVSNMVGTVQRMEQERYLLIYR